MASSALGELQAATHVLGELLLKHGGKFPQASELNPDELRRLSQYVQDPARAIQLLRQGASLLEGVSLPGQPSGVTWPTYLTYRAIEARAKEENALAALEKEASVE